MTRFARARGSKSSNQKLPEKPTPWSQMREMSQPSEINGSSSPTPTDEVSRDVKRSKHDSFSNVEKFDGFSVLNEDAVKLRQEKYRLINQGVPRHQLKARLMPMRRNAEKRLSRMRKKICYHCRRPGHMLNQCTELGSSTALGVCFKCGSTEHKLHECRHTGNNNQLEFAKCFICNEEGHISRQCPDNPMGLYPNGGGCKLCGDVTHFAKDCPEKQKRKREEDLPTVGIMDDRLVEDLFDEKTNFKQNKQNNTTMYKKKKLVVMK